VPIVGAVVAGEEDPVEAEPNDSLAGEERSHSHLAAVIFGSIADVDIEASKSASRIEEVQLLQPNKNVLAG